MRNFKFFDINLKRHFIFIEAKNLVSFDSNYYIFFLYFNIKQFKVLATESSMKIKFINVSLVQKLVAIRCVENVETSFLAHLDSDAHLLQIIIRYGFVIKCMT